MENPVAFLPTFAARVLGTAHLHSLYAGLLAWPWRLCCDWSYACVVPVERLADPRNAGSVALYAGLAAVGLAALGLDRKSVV